MRLTHTLALTLLVAAAGCGGRDRTTQTTQRPSKKDLGVRVYPRAKIEGSWTHTGGPKTAVTHIATCVTRDSVDEVDKFYRKTLGRKAERIVAHDPQGDSVSYMLKKDADEQISVGIMRDKSRKRTVFMITRTVGKP